MANRTLGPRDIAGVLAVVTVWGIGFTLTKPAVDHFPPIFLMAVCFGLTAAVLTVATREKSVTGHLAAAVISLFAVTLQAMLIFRGLQGLEASTAVLVAQTQVPMAAIFAWMIAGERIDAMRMIALAVAFAGVALIAGRPDAPPNALSLATLLSGCAAWAIGQPLIAKLGRDADGAVLLKRVSLHGTLQLALASAFMEGGQDEAIAAASMEQWAYLAFIAVFAFAGAYVVWFRLLSKHKVTAVTPFVMLMPVISVTFSAIFLGERPSLVTLAGGVLIVSGVALASGVLNTRRSGAA